MSIDASFANHYDAPACENKSKKRTRNTRRVKRSLKRNYGII